MQWERFLLRLLNKDPKLLLKVMILHRIYDVPASDLLGISETKADAMLEERGLHMLRRLIERGPYSSGQFFMIIRIIEQFKPDASVLISFKNTRGIIIYRDHFYKTYLIEPMQRSTDYGNYLASLWINFNRNIVEEGLWEVRIPPMGSDKKYWEIIERKKPRIVLRF